MLLVFDLTENYGKTDWIMQQRLPKLDFFLEAHREKLMIPESYLENLYKHRPLIGDLIA